MDLGLSIDKFTRQLNSATHAFQELALSWNKVMHAAAHVQGDMMSDMTYIYGERGWRCTQCGDYTIFNTPGNADKLVLADRQRRVPNIYKEIAESP